jgi:hypothetical protein
MRAWMLSATDCSCETLDACALFDATSLPSADDTAEVLHIRHVAASG